MRLFLPALMLVSCLSFAATSVPDVPAQLKIVSNSFSYPNLSTDQKALLENYFIDGAACGQDDCLSKIFICEDPVNNQETCKIGYSDDVRERGFILTYGVEVVVDLLQDMKVISVKDFKTDPVFYLIR